MKNLIGAIKNVISAHKELTLYGAYLKTYVIMWIAIILAYFIMPYSLIFIICPLLFSSTFYIFCIYRYMQLSHTRETVVLTGSLPEGNISKEGYYTYNIHTPADFYARRMVITKICLFNDKQDMDRNILNVSTKYDTLYGGVLITLNSAKPIDEYAVYFDSLECKNCGFPL